MTPLPHRLGVNLLALRSRSPHRGRGRHARSARRSAQVLGHRLRPVGDRVEQPLAVLVRRVGGGDHHRAVEAHHRGHVQQPGRQVVLPGGTTRGGDEHQRAAAPKEPLWAGRRLPEREPRVQDAIEVLLQDPRRPVVPHGRGDHQAAGCGRLERQLLQGAETLGVRLTRGPGERRHLGAHVLQVVLHLPPHGLIPQPQVLHPQLRLRDRQRGEERVGPVRDDGRRPVRGIDV
mmetsp:Transcript_2828/g.9534  ORF Transcript_2828/g.9534 Transcript_2828/m.9534 type:complete len:232 (-) Transcript_2828:109-804(-)